MAKQSISRAVRHATGRYAALGVDVDAAFRTLARMPVSLHDWQGGDVRGFARLPYNLLLHMQQKVAKAKPPGGGLAGRKASRSSPAGIASTATPCMASLAASRSRGRTSIN